MYLSINLKFGEDSSGEDYAAYWKKGEVTITHTFYGAYFVATLDAEDNIFLVQTILRDGETIIVFPEEVQDFEFRVNILGGSNAENGGNGGGGGGNNDSPTTGAKYYSGTIDDVMLFCKSLDVSGDRLASLSPVKIERYQQIVDDAIDGYLCEYYFIPLTEYNQVMPDGSIRKVFPGKIRFLAIQWVAGLILQTEFQNMEPNLNEAGTRFVEEAKKEMQQMVTFSTRIPGQRRKHPSPTMPPNLAPSKTNEFIL